MNEINLSSESPQEPKARSGPKDVFLHLATMLALYFSAGSFITLIFQYINIYFPDVLEGSGSYYLQSAHTSIRWSIAVLIVVFPVYLLISRYMNRIYERQPEKRNMRTRKWLIYLTLFAAAVIIVGDIVTLVYKLLGGELTIRFVLKVLTLLFVSGSVFYYYFSDLRKYRTE